MVRHLGRSISTLALWPAVGTASRSALRAAGVLAPVIGSGNGDDGEFDPSSGQTLAAYLRHASRTVAPDSSGVRVADG